MAQFLYRFKPFALVLAVTLLLLFLPGGSLRAEQPTRFVLISAGPDGVVGTPDDIYTDGQGGVKHGAVDLAALASVRLIPSAGGEAVLAAPQAPGGLRVTGVTDRSVSLAWDSVLGAKAYRVYTGDVLAAEVAGTAAEVTGLAPATGYTFTVSAVGLTEGPKCPPVSALTAPTAPAGLRATGTSPSSVSLAWDPVQGAASYKVYMDGTFKMAVQSNSAEISGLLPSTNYAFAVSAVGTAGAEGPKSAALTVSTPAPEADLLAYRRPIGSCLYYLNNSCCDPAYATDRDPSTHVVFDAAINYPFYYLLYDLGKPSHITAYRTVVSSPIANDVAITFMDETKGVLASYRVGGDTGKVPVDLCGVRYVKVDGPYRYYWPGYVAVYEIYAWGN